MGNRVPSDDTSVTSLSCRLNGALVGKTVGVVGTGATGIQVIQIDEPAIREGLPLRRRAPVATFVAVGLVCLAQIALLDHVVAGTSSR